MELKTILDAMLMADRRRIAPAHIQRITPNVQRQYRAFRARILRMDAEKDARIVYLEERVDFLDRLLPAKNPIDATHDYVEELEQECKEMDARIAELEGFIDRHNQNVLDAFNKEKIE